MRRCILLLALVGCGGDPDPAPLPLLSMPPPTEPVPGMVSLSTTITDAAGVEVEVRLDLPPGEPAPLHIVIPGLGPAVPGPTKIFARGDEQPGGQQVAAILSIGKPGCLPLTNPIFCLADEYRHATRPTLREHVRLAYTWAQSLGVTAPRGHTVFARATAAPDAVALAPFVDAERIVWSYPVVQGVGAYLEDELLRRAFWTQRARADGDCDGNLDPEEWGIYRGAHDPDAPPFVTVDRDGDGLYTLADSELAGAEEWSELQAIVEAGDEEAWGSFWDEPTGHDGTTSPRFPSVAWARASWDPPPFDAWLSEANVPIELVALRHVAAPPEPVLALLESYPSHFVYPEELIEPQCWLRDTYLGQEL